MAHRKWLNLERKERKKFVDKLNDYTVFKVDNVHRLNESLLIHLLMRKNSFICSFVP